MPAASRGFWLKRGLKGSRKSTLSCSSRSKSNISILSERSGNIPCLSLTPKLSSSSRSKSNISILSERSGAEDWEDCKKGIGPSRSKSNISILSERSCITELSLISAWDSGCSFVAGGFPRSSYLSMGTFLMVIPSGDTVMVGPSSLCALSPYWQLIPPVTATFSVCDNTKSNSNPSPTLPGAGVFG